MTKINCSVNNCSHNKEASCYANRINIGGKGSMKSCNTCCGSFLDKLNYSTLTNNTDYNGACDCLVCDVETCTYNNNKLCSADCISVAGTGANIYTETKCSTFELK